MASGPHRDWIRRQDQWEAFHRWEASRAPFPLSLEQRIAWYVEAFSFSRAHASAQAAARIQTKVEEIREVRDRLARLDSMHRNV
jgi:hypothetical protein